jgi:HEPN domain-containing protein
MATTGQRNHARSFLKKAEEYLASAEDNLAAKRYTPAAGDAIHAGISAKDAILTALTGATGKGKGKDHATAAKELRQALATRPEAVGSEKSMRELIAAKGDVEYGTDLVTATKAQPLVRRARTLVDLAIEIVRLGR